MRARMPTPMTVLLEATRERIVHYWSERDNWRVVICSIFLGSVLLIVLENLQPTLVNVVQELSGAGILFRSTACETSHITPRPTDWHNLLLEESSNYTRALLESLYVNATSPSPCYSDVTSSTILEGLPKPVQGKYIFQTDKLHNLTLVAYSVDGEKRCSGGDYYEVNFHDGEAGHYRSRLPTVDFGNGSYGLELIVPSRFAGTFTVEIWMLFSNWHGMDDEPLWWVKKTLMVAQEMELVDPGRREQFCLKNKLLHNTELKQCTQADFDRTTWQGRWSRLWFNDSCAPDNEKRFRCLPEEHCWCEEPWCFGPVGSLESNGWAYSAHCSFKIFQREEAWKCLNGRWFLMWGDSNFQDTIRNLLLFILEWEMPLGANLADFQLSRTYEAEFVNPREHDQVFRVSQQYNGAAFVDGNGEGLRTLHNQEHQQALLDHFKDNDTLWPDTVIMNSGLHDGNPVGSRMSNNLKIQAFQTAEDYAGLADFTIDWWVKLYNGLPADRRPQMIWRTTVAPAGDARGYGSNPNKMEMYNQVIVEKVKNMGDKFPVKFVDAFDLTFPFHYSNEYSDGGHYGRAPGADGPPWWTAPHWYFVDIMLAHIFLNAACPPM